MVLLYSTQKTNRLEYVVEHIFTRMLGLKTEICTDDATFNAYQGCKINYSDKKFENCLKIAPHPLLFEETICRQHIVFSHYNGFPVCFRTEETASLPFDIFAASFYFLSRYEEYISPSDDLHQRFDAKNSLAYKNGLLHLPLVDCWAAELKQVLKNACPQLPFPERTFSFIPTYDIDLPFAWLQKGFALQAAGYVKLLLKLNFKKIALRTKVLLKKEKDPFYTFDYLTAIHQQHQLRPCYFFLAAKRKSKYDRNPSRTNKAFRTLIRNLALSSEIGLHASFHAKEKPQRTGDEKAWLQTLTHQPIVKNRFHFLRFTLPDGYRQLLANGITEDYSMGYANHIGFRAGTCTPFPFFDLPGNTAANLLVYPLLCMENAFANAQSADEIIQIIHPYIETIKKYNGTFTALFHNHAFEEKKWKTVLEYVVSIAN